MRRSFSARIGSRLDCPTSNSEIADVLTNLDRARV